MSQQPPNEKPPRQRQLRLQMPANPSATYANTVMISHTQNEVIFDFIQIMPNDASARVQHRIVMTPVHAKMFMKALTDNIHRYEEKNGEIELPARPQSLAEQLFKGVRPPDQQEDDEVDE